ncbi:hypothetical protein BgiMline_007562 [Biomphalaria glabrata]|nr:zinc finger protein 628-like [Biomphalaria glabrata]
MQERNEEKTTETAAQVAKPEVDVTPNPVETCMNANLNWRNFIKIIKFDVKSKKRKLPNALQKNLKKQSIQPSIKTGDSRNFLSNMSENNPDTTHSTLAEQKGNNLSTTGAITCQYCSTAFPNKEAYLNHTKLSMLAGPNSVHFQCLVCLKNFAFKAHLEAHMIVHHIQLKEGCNQKFVLYKCNYCDNKITSSFGLKKHIMRHTMESEFKCCVCGKEFRLFKQLKLHYDHHSLEDKVKCRCCNKVFPNKAALGQYHLTSNMDKMNEKEKPDCDGETTGGVMCPHCDNKFPDKQAFLNHRKLVRLDNSEIDTYQCSSCPKVFPYKAHLKAHMIFHHTQGRIEKFPLHKCDSCDSRFKKYCDLKKHILCHTGECDIKCCVCGKEFRGLSGLYAHYIDHSSGSTVCCKCCNQFFPNKAELVKHKILAHSPNDVNMNKQMKKPGSIIDARGTNNKITCPHCDTVFPHQQAFLDHIKLNKFLSPDSVTFQCIHCPKIFPFKAHVQAHIIVHHTQDEKPDYKCSFCDHICKDYHDLKRHIMCHTGEYDYKCCICDKRFRGVYALNAHYMHHSSEYMVRCQPCDQLFPNKTALHQHKTNYHPSSQDGKKMRTRISDGEVTCQFCATVFPHKRAFSNHTKIGKLSEPNSVTFQCSSCSKVYPFKAHLQAHRIVHHSISKDTEDANSDLYKCDSCDHTCKDYNDLKRHIMCHTEEFDEKCCVCGKQFRSISALRAHYIHHKSDSKLTTHSSDNYENGIRTKQKDVRIYKPHIFIEVTCPHCNTVFPNKKAFSLHTKVNKFDDTDSAAFQCNQCPKVFPFEAHLQAHVIVHHTQAGDEKPAVYKCNSCHHESKEFYDLKKHIMSHTGEFDVKCCVCGKRFRDRSSLNTHYFHHTIGGMIRCTCCWQFFPSRAALGKHRAAKVEAKCHLCGQVYPNKTSRNQHYRQMHQHDILRCDKCTFLFSSHEELAAHMKRHKINKKKPCPICGKLFSRIEFHMIVHRSEPGVKLQHLMCDKCPYMSYNRASFQRHLANHSSDKPYRCPNCSKTFNHSTSLRRHLKSHSSSMPYECGVCGKRCKEVGNLRVHQRIHSAIKHYSCLCCSKMFNHKNSLDLHMKNKHAVIKCHPDPVSGTRLLSLPPDISKNSQTQVFTLQQTLNVAATHDGLIIPNKQQAESMATDLIQDVKCVFVEAETLSTVCEIKKENFDLVSVEEANQVEDDVSGIDVKPLLNSCVLPSS